MAKPPMGMSESQREYDLRMARDHPDRYPLPPSYAAEQLMIGFRRFPDLTFAEAFHSCTLVRVLFAACAIFAGLALGLAGALVGR